MKNIFAIAGAVAIVASAVAYTRIRVHELEQDTERERVKMAAYETASHINKKGGVSTILSSGSDEDLRILYGYARAYPAKFKELFDIDNTDFFLDACSSANPDILKRGLHLGLRPKSKHDEWLILTCAVRTSAEHVRLLLKSGANPNAQENGTTILQWAVQSHAPEVIKVLLVHGADPNTRLADEQNPCCGGWPSAATLRFCALAT